MLLLWGSDAMEKFRRENWPLESLSTVWLVIVVEKGCPTCYLGGTCELLLLKFWHEKTLKNSDWYKCRLKSVTVSLTILSTANIDVFMVVPLIGRE